MLALLAPSLGLRCPRPLLAPPAARAAPPFAAATADAPAADADAGGDGVHPELESLQASYERQTKTIKRQVKYIAELQAQVQASTTELEEALAAASLAASKAAAAADGAAVDSVRRRQALMKPSIDVPFSVEATEGAPGQTTKLKEPVPGGPGYQAPLEFGAETPLPGREKEYADYKASSLPLPAPTASPPRPPAPP